MQRGFLLQITLTLTLAGASPAVAADDAWVNLGRALFFDVNLSAQRTQACATCHMPDQAFTDARSNATGGAVSLGDDGASLGTRNTPTLSYVAQTPAFHIDRHGEYHGGLFYDGRAADLAAQATQPIVNPIEMALTDQHQLAQRVLENSAYVEALRQLTGAAGLTVDAISSAVARALAAFQQTPSFQPFDSKYDRYLRGEYTLTRAEEHGRLLFFSSLINCNSCHLLDRGVAGETFTDYSYHNIGVPPNPVVVQHGNGELPDFGLLANPLVDDPYQAGKFKVPTLRNIAVTAPYMHNGVFRDLRTVLAFYNKFILAGTDNPETHAPWAAPEVDANISLELLRQGQPMDEYRIQTLIAFMNTLTDRQFEHLLEE